MKDMMRAIGLIMMAVMVFGVHTAAAGQGGDGRKDVPPADTLRMWKNK